MRHALFKTIALSALLLATTACGFTPLYAEKDMRVANGLSSIYVVPIPAPEKPGFQLQNALNDRLAPSGTPEFDLKVVLRETRESLAVTQSANTIRYNYKIDARYTLTQRGTANKWQGRVTAVSGFGVVKSQYASLVGEDDAVRKAVLELADKLEIELALFIRGARTKIEPVEAEADL